MRLNSSLSAFATAVLVAISSFSSINFGQDEPKATTEISDELLRFELGQRLRRFEGDFENHLAEDQRAKALAPMKVAVSRFFSGQMTGAASALDESWVRLFPKDQQEAARTISALRVHPNQWFADSNDSKFEFSLDWFREPKSELPPDAKLIIEFINLDNAKAEQIESPISVGSTYTVPSPQPGQYMIHVFITHDGHQLPIGSFAAAHIDDFDQRITKVETALENAKDKDAAWNKSVSSTARDMVKYLKRWNRKNDLETIWLAARQLDRLEKLVDHANEDDWLESSWGVNENGGDFYLSLAAQKYGRSQVRLFVPAKTKRTDPEKLMPCVIALHGAGGSENMFFDTYGDGKVLRLAQERGWVVVAPRLGFAGPGISLPEMVETLSTQLPIDPDSVFVVGHSMGAGQAMNSVQKLESESDSFQFRAVSAIGGGARVRLSKTPEFPFFIAAGSDDFGKSGARSLHRFLDNAGCESTYREYKETEHMCIVQVALDDVFAFFDEQLRTEK